MFLQKQLCSFMLVIALITALDHSALAQIPSYLPTDSLVAWWPFNGNANDESGNNHNASPSDFQFLPVSTIDRFGNANSALLFDGSNDFLEIPHHIDFNSLPITFSFWMKTDGYSTQQIVLNKYCCSSWNGWNVQFGYFGGQNSWEFAYFRGTCQGIFQTYCNPQPFPISDGFDNAWHNYVFVVDTTGSRVYQDGNLFLQQDWFFNGADPSSIITPVTNSLPVNIGRYGAGNELFYSGYLDDIAIWKRALSAEEVQAIFGAHIRVYNDFDNNCSYEVGASAVSGALLSIEPGGSIAMTEPSGVFFIDSENLPDGSYTATVNTNNTNWEANCFSSIDFSISNGVITGQSELPLINTNPCPSPDISITCPTIRRCSEHTWPIYVYACNDNLGTGILENAYVQVALDASIIVDPATTPPYTMVNGLYQFEIGNLNPGQCITLVINANFSCDLELDETLCMEATLYPVPECLQDTVPVPGTCELPWDHSSLSVNGTCDETTGMITFTITNNGDAMDCQSEVRVYADGDLDTTFSIQLGAGETYTYTFPSTPDTWILQADQHPLHPGNSHPNDHVEGCGDIPGVGDGDDDNGDGDTEDDDEWEPGLVDDLPCGDESPFVDEFCGQVVGSFDPNDKQGFPAGVGETHDVLPNEQLQYLIRFQNTGTAPAYTVVIRDTLDTDLDIFSVTPGVASHDYSFTMYGERVLQWTFNNIMLPDSFSNEEASHGFITYTVNQAADLADGTEITNSAAIYFDSNEPVITNTTLHTINYCLFKDTHSTLDATSCGSYIAPDGQTYDVSGTYTAVLVNAAGCDSTITIHLQSIDLNPQVEGNGTGTLTASPAGLTYQWINCDTNTPVVGATSATYSGESGNYAVQVSDGTCMEQSECAQLVGLNELTSPHLSVYPVPASQQITVAWTGNATGYTITLPDGRVLASGRLASGVNVIDISTLASGNYFLKVDNRVTRFVVK